MKIDFKFPLVLITAPALFYFSCKQPARDVPYQCNCSEVGIDSSWADSSDVVCYQVPVSQNANNYSSSKKILMAVAVVKASGASPLEPLLYLHGGPGISTLSNVKRYINSPAWKLIREKHDLVFFDYRGTGFSQPDLCSDLMDSLDNFRKTNPSMEEYFKRETDLFRECASVLKRDSIDITSFTSPQVAADAEAIRAALGIEKWNLYGVSYGTFIALKYIRHYPGNLNNVVLDSPFPPNTPWLDFVRPMNAVLAHIQGYLDEDSITRRYYPDIRRELGTAIRRLNSKPPLVNGLTYWGDEFAWSVQRALLKPTLVPLVPLVIKEVAGGNDSILAIWKEKIGPSGSYGKYSAAQETAMLCYENRPQNPGDMADSLAKKYPDLVSFNLGFKQQLCDVFRPELPAKDYFAPVSSDIPVMIMSGEFDPVTPPYFGEIAANSLSNARVMVVQGASHAVLHFNDCTMDRVKQFLKDPKNDLSNQCQSEKGKTIFATAGAEELLKKLK